MKMFKRILTFALALMFAMSPILQVRATDTEAPSQIPLTYDELIAPYRVICSDDFSDENNTLVSTITTPDTIFRETDTSGNTYIKFYKDAASSTFINIKYSDPDEEDVDTLIFEADVRWDNPGDKIQIYNLGEARKVFVSIENGSLAFLSPDGSTKTALTPGSWHKITYVADMANNKFTAYVDEELIVSGKTMVADYGTITGFRFQSTTPSASAEKSEEKDFYIDNVKFYKIYIPAYDKLMSGSVHMGLEDFSEHNEETTSLSATASSANTIFVADEGYLKFHKAGSLGTYADLKHNLGEPEEIVFEADIRWDNPGLNIQFLSRTENKVLMRFENGTLTFCSPYDEENNISNDTVVSLEKGKWYKVTYAINVISGRYDAFINEEKVASKREIPKGITKLTQIRLQTTTPTSSNVSEEKDFLIDNVNWYLAVGSADVPVEITPNGDGSFTTDSTVLQWIAAQDNLTAISPYEGKYFVGGEKKEAAGAFICKQGEYLVSVDIFRQVFGVAVDVNGNTVTAGKATFVIGEKKIRVAGTEYAIDEAAYTVNGITYLPFYGYAENATDKFISESEYGDVILSDSKLTFTDKQRFEVDLFLTKTRPSAAQIQADYVAGGNANSHPRIWKDAEGFAELKRLTETDARARLWWLSIKSDADALVSSGVISPGDDIYNFSKNTVLSPRLEAVRQFCSEAKLLGLAYNLTGNQAYAELLKNKMLYIISHNRSWYDLKGEIHYLTHGQLAEGMGIGYDWIYDYLTEEERAKIEKWSHDGVLVPIREAFYAGTTGDFWWTTTTLNWNTVVTGGEIVLALSLADVYPEICFDAIEKALRSGEYSLSTWAPDGGWYEGNSYARYTAQYMEYELSALNSVLGTMYDREKSRGLSDASFYMYYIDSFAGGSVNFGDSDTAHAKVLSLYWANLYQSKELAVLLEKWNEELETGFGTLRDFLYYDPALFEDSENVELALDKFFAGDRSQMVVTREGWDTAEQMFACWAGGRMDQSHDHADAGSFIYDINGYRFICDPGAKNYTFSGEDWDYFRKRAEAHNVIVINPDESSTPGKLGQKEPGQDRDGHAEVLFVNSGSGGVISAIDLQDMYKKQTSSYIRGFMTMDNRRSLVVRDEITLTQPNSKLYWNLITLGSITIVDENTAIITRDDQAIKLEFITNADSFKVYRTDAEPYPFSPQPTDGETLDSMFSRLMVEMVASGEFYIAVKISPVGEGIDPTVPTTAIADWEPAEATEKTQVNTKGNVVTSITVDGREIFEKGVRSYRVVLSGENPQLPVIKAIPAAGRKAQIIHAKSLGEATVIIVFDPKNPSYSENYVIRYDVIPKYEEIENRPRYDIINFEVSEETDDRYLGIGCCDGDTGTKWLSENLGAYAIQELVKEQEIHAIAVAFDYSDAREYTFEIQVSSDGINYESVLKKTTPKTSVNGKMLLYTLDQPVTAKYVKYISGGSSTNTKSNLIELAILGLSTVCGDMDMNHRCDDGCGKTYGVCEDTNTDHKCDYGCSKFYGVCTDTNKDHICDYGCKIFKGACTDFNKDHICDYGCERVWGKCEDADEDGECDYGCDKSFTGEGNTGNGAQQGFGLWAAILNFFAMIANFFKSLFGIH